MKIDINLNLYKTFYEVAKYKSVSKAASMTYTSQPAISKAIQKLEEELNTKLFYRNPSGMTLTEKGKELLFYVEEAYNSILVGEKTLIEEKNLEKGTITIGVPSQIGTFYLFDFIDSFHRDYPNIEITIISNGTDNLLKKLSTHEIDFIIDSSPILTSNDSVIIKPLTKVDNCFISKKGYFKDKLPTSLKELENIPMILPIEKTANRVNLNQLLKKENIEFNNKMNIHTSEMILGAVKRNLGVGYIIKDLIKDDSEIEILPIKEELPKIEINLIYVEKYLTTIPTEFIKMFIDHKFINKDKKI